MTDRVLIYSAFCADFGPMNLSAVHRFCKIMKEKMENKDLAGKKLVYFTGATPQLRTNCVFLLGCYLCTELGMSPEEAWQCFGKFEPSPYMGYRDATFVRSTWDLSIIDCWRGLLKGIKSGLINFATFNPDEYDYYDHPQHGDMHVMVPSKFIAFKGPTGRRYRLAPGLFSHTPKDYVEVFRHHKVCMERGGRGVVGEMVWQLSAGRDCDVIFSVRVNVHSQLCRTYEWVMSRISRSLGANDFVVRIAGVRDRAA